MKEFVTIGYSYDELNDAAKERVKQWYLDTSMRNEFFHEDIMNYLKENFPRSELKVQYSLSSCQGDGFNVYGRVNMYDFLEKWDACEEVKNWMKKILDNTDHWYNLSENKRYCYSLKLSDTVSIGENVRDTIIALEDTELNIVDSSELIKQFYKALLTHFLAIDKKFEKDGYKYLYECENDEVKEHCEANDYYFTEKGEFIG